MPVFQIKDPDTGRTVTVEGDSEPTQEDAVGIFASLPSQDSARVQRVIESGQGLGILWETPRSQAELDIQNLQAQRLPGGGYAPVPGTSSPDPIGTLMAPIAERVNKQMVSDARETLRVANQVRDEINSGDLLLSQREARTQELLGTPSVPPSVSDQVITGTLNVMGGMSSPFNLATLGMGALPSGVGKVASAAFLADTARHAATDSATAMGRASVEGDLADKIEAFGGFGVSALFGGGMGLHLAEGRLAGSRPEARAEDLPSEEQTVLSRPKEASTDFGDLPENAALSDQQANDLAAALDAPKAEAVISEPPTPKGVIPSGEVQKEIVQGQDEVLTPSAAGSETSPGSGAIPLGLNRPVAEDRGLRLLSDAEFNARNNAARNELDTAEALHDQGAIVPEVLAQIQDRFSAHDLEAFRRSHEDVVPQDLFRELKDMAGTAVKFGRGSEQFEKARILLEELQRQGATREDIFKELKLSSPDAAEIFAADLKDIETLIKETQKPITQRVLEAEPGKLTPIFEENGQSLTSAAYDLGSKTDTQAKLDELLAGKEEAKKRFDAAMAAGNFDQAWHESSKSQFFREAAEYATGTGGAGDWQKKEMPNYKPPMAEGPAKKKLEQSLRDVSEHLEDWKMKGDGNVYSTLLPGFDPATFKATWNTAIEAVQGALKGSASLVEAVRAGLAVLREKAGEGYDEAKAMDALLATVQVGPPPQMSGPLLNREFIGTSKSSLGRFETLRQTEAGREQYAKELADQYEGNPRAALAAINGLGDEAFAAVARAEVLSRLVQKMYQPGAPEYLETVRDIQRLGAETLAGGTAAGQSLQSRAQVNRKLQSAVPVLSWLDLLQRRQASVVDEAVPPVVKERIGTAITDSGVQASNDISRGAPDPEANPSWMGSNASIQKLLRSAMKTAGENWRDLFTALPEVQEARKAEITRRITDLPQFDKLTPEQKASLATALDEAWQRQRMAVFRSEFDKVVPLPEVTAEAKSQIEDAIPELFRQANLGLLDKLSFRDALARKMGLEGLDGPTSKELAKIGQEAERAPEGVIRNKLFDRAKKLIEENSSINPYELAKSIWYADILSGLATGTTIGMGGVLIGTPTILLAAADAATVMRSPLKALSMLGAFFKPIVGGEGFRNFVDTMTSGDYTRYPEFQRRFSENLEGRFRPEELEKLLRNDFFEHPIKKSVGTLAYVNRALTGLDQWASLGVRDAGAIYAAMSRGDQVSLGELMRKFDLKETAKAAEQAKKDFESAGIVPRKGDLLARQREILEQGVAREIREAGNDLGMMANLNQHPTGIRGVVYDGLSKFPLWARAPLGLTFLRGMLNMMGEAANWTAGAGLVNYARTAPRFTEAAAGEKRGSFEQALNPETPPEQRRLMMAKALAGLALTTGAAYVFLGKDHDDQKWEIAGSFQGLTPIQKKTLMEAGIRPLSLWRRNPESGKIESLSYKETPFSGALAIIGHMRDQELYRGKHWDDISQQERILNGTVMGFSGITELSFMDQAAKILGISNQAQIEKPEEASFSAMRKLAQAGAGVAGGLTPFSGLLKDIDTWMDPKVYRPDPKDTAGIVLRNIPFARRLSSSEPAINIFGDPIEYSRKPWSRMLTELHNDPEMSILSQKAAEGVFPTRPSPNTHIVDSTGHQRQMTDAEFYAYQKVYGQLFKAIVKANAEKILALPPADQLQQKIMAGEGAKLEQMKPDDRLAAEKEIKAFVNANSAEGWFSKVHSDISEELKKTILYGPEKKQ